MLREEDGRELLSVARKAIISSVNNQEISAPPSFVSRFNEKSGVFVTITKNKQLRGCIGFPEPIFPLWKALIEAARSAALNDPRFPPLTREELKDVKVEVTVLTPPEEIKGDAEELKKQIEIGRHGLIVRAPYGSGLLLPQVFVEYNATPEMALGMTCEKAGLESSCWKKPTTSIFRFEGIVFNEE